MARGLFPIVRAVVAGALFGCTSSPRVDFAVVPGAPLGVGTAASPLPSSAPPTQAVLAADCRLTARPLAARATATWGDVRPAVWLTPESDGLRAWFAAGYRRPFQSAALKPDGALGATREEAPFAPFGEASYPFIAAGPANSAVAAVATVYVAPENGDIYATVQTGGRFPTPVAVMPGPELDTDPTAALAADGRLGVAWNHGAYPNAPDLAFAVLRPDGTLEHGAVIATGVEAEGIAVVALPRGWLVLFTPSSAGPSAERGLDALLLDAHGGVLTKRRLADGPYLWPVASWNGTEVAIALSGVDPSGGGAVGFLRLDALAAPLAPLRVVDRHPDPLASFRALALVPDDAGYWLADVASFHASVMIARRSEGRVVRLDGAGTPAGSFVVGDDAHGASVVMLARTPAGVRGVFVTDAGEELHAFDAQCGKPSAAPPASPCDPVSTPIADAHHEALRHPFRAVALANGDLAVSYRTLRSGKSGIDEVRAARLDPAGVSLWDVGLGPGYQPELAAAPDSLAVVMKTGDGAPQTLVLLDIATGSVRARRELAADAGDHCIAATPSGWLVVRGAGYAQHGTARAVMLAADGSTAGEQPFDDDLTSCALAPSGGGFALAYTHPGPMSETNYLFVRRLDRSGRALGSGRRLETVHFATSPTLGTVKGAPALAFADALGRDLAIVALDAQAAPRGVPQDVARSYGLAGFAFAGDALVWQSGDALGRRTCLAALLTAPPDGTRAP